MNSNANRIDAASAAPLAKTKWQTRELEPGDGPLMRALFEDVFGHPMTESHWQWKYGENRGRGIGVWDGDRLIAHYGGVQRLVLDAGAPRSAVQIADVAVTERERGHLTRRGPYFLATSSFLERFIGTGKSYLYGFGFPSERHFRLAKVLGLYELSDRIVEFSFPPLPGAHRCDVPATGMRTLAGNGRLCKALDDAWKRMRADLHALLLGVRDLDFLLHRYSDHPHFSYQLLAIRGWPFGPPKAFAVVRLVPELGLEWLDMIGQTRDIPRLAQAVQRHAFRNRAPKVFGWITESQQHYFSPGADCFRPTEVIVPANSWCPDPLPATQKNRWWLMAGDTDFH